VVGMVVEIPPARGLAYAGPVVMSFGCFAVVFACVVVCETRDRVLETMEERVRRGLPARPPGGIRADFYALVVEVRKRRVERHRHRRKLLLQRGELDDEDERSRLQPTPSTADVRSPSTIDDFEADRSDEATRLPTLRVQHPDELPDVAAPDSPDRWRSNPPTFSDDPRSGSADVGLGAVTTPGGRQAARRAGENLSPSWQPTTMPLSSRSSLSFDNDVFASASFDASPDSGSTVVRPTTTEAQPRPSQHPFPLLEPISSFTQSQMLPYVRLESSSQPLAAPTCSFLHTASVHAIADRSPDLVARPDTTPFDFPPTTDFRYGSDDVTSGDVTSGDVAAASGRWNSVVVADARRDVGSTASFGDDVLDVRTTDAALSDPLRGGFAESLAAAAADDESPVADVVNQTERRRPRTPEMVGEGPEVVGMVGERPEVVGTVGPRTPDAAATLPTARTSTAGDHCADRRLERLARSTADDGEPSRKRPRGATGQPRWPGDDSGLLSDRSQCDPAGTSLPAVSPYLISGERWAAAAAADTCGDAAPFRSDADAPCRRRRRANGIHHLLSSDRRRRRRPDSATGSTHFDEDSDRGLAHHSADELDSFLSVRDDGGRPSDRPTDCSDEMSPLIWLRRRMTISPQRPGTTATDPHQSTV